MKSIDQTYDNTPRFTLKNKKLGFYSNYYKNDSIYKLNVDLLKNNGAELYELNPKSVQLNDFRKLCNIDAYTPVDNISEITAKTNDEGFETIFDSYLRLVIIK